MFTPRKLFVGIPAYGALSLLLLPTLCWALSGADAIAIVSILKRTPAAELPAAAQRLVTLAKDKNGTAKLIVDWTAKAAPGALDAVRNAIPAANRPPVTPGNDNGNRPDKPPGLDKYGSP